MQSIKIPDENGKLLNARVDVGDGHLILHSRSGTGAAERNPDYRPALEIILARLEGEGCFPTVYLDSRPAQKLALDQRKIVDPDELIDEVEGQFNLIVRRSNSLPGSKSHGAYRRILLATEPFPAYALTSLLQWDFPERFSADQLQQVTRQHLDKAMAALTATVPTFHSFSKPTSYWVMTHDDEALPPKAVFGLALSEAFRTYTHPYQFSSGGQIFKIMRGHGLKIISKADFTPNQSRKFEQTIIASSAVASHDFPMSQDDYQAVEGDPKFVTHLRRERSSALVLQKRDSFRKTHGRLFCERCDFDPVKVYGSALAEGCMEVHHTIPIAQMDKGHVSQLADLQLLCANCHRVTHREMTLSKAKSS